MIATAWAAFVAWLGPKGVRIAWIVIVALIALALAFGLGRCGDRSEDIATQIEQSNKSGEAFQDATADAIGRIGDRTVTEGAIDDAVEQVKDEIGDAKSPDDIRRALLDSLCGQPSHRDDPACGVRKTDPVRMVNPVTGRANP